MTREQFTSSLNDSIVKKVVIGNISQLEKPAGREPDSMTIEQSKWYNSASIHDKKMIEQLIREASKSTVFRILCVLDGVSTMGEVGRTGSLKLWFESDLQEPELLNPSHGEMLHDLFNDSE